MGPRHRGEGVLGGPQRDRAGGRAGCSGHLLLSFCGWFKNILVKIHSHQALPLLLPRQVEADYLVDAVVDGPVKLLGLVAGQHQHEPAATGAAGAEAPQGRALASQGGGLLNPPGAVSWRLLLGSFVTWKTTGSVGTGLCCPLYLRQSVLARIPPSLTKARPDGGWMCTGPLGTGTPGPETDLCPCLTRSLGSGEQSHHLSKDRHTSPGPQGQRPQQKRVTCLT